MTNSPDPRSSSRTPLGFDDFVGVFIALGVIGAILFWSLSRRGEGWQIPSIVSLSPSTTPSAVNPTPQATESPIPNRSVPLIIPTPTPEVLTPEVPETTIRRQTPPAIVPVVPVPIPQPTTPLIIPTPTPEVLTPEVPETTIRRQTPPARVPVPVPIPQPTTPPARVPVPVPIPQPTTPPARVPVPVPIPQPTATTTPAPTVRVNFLDVPPDHWAYPFITSLAQRGIVNGFPGGYFKPTDPVTRAEFAALLQAAFTKKPGRDNVRVFKDVPPNFWGVPAIDQAIQTGFLSGYPDNTFQPQQEISKVEVIVALTSGLNLAPPSFPGQVLQNFYQDADQIPQYATEKVAAASTAGLVVNYPDAKLLNPNQNATRAEVAGMIHQALVRSGTLPPIESPYIAGVQRRQ